MGLGFRVLCTIRAMSNMGLGFRVICTTRGHITASWACSIHLDPTSCLHTLEISCGGIFQGQGSGTWRRSPAPTPRTEWVPQWSTSTSSVANLWRSLHYLHPKQWSLHCGRLQAAPPMSPCRQQRMPHDASTNLKAILGWLQSLSLYRAQSRP